MRGTRWLAGCLLAAAVAVLPGTPAHAQKAADTLRVTWRDGIPDLNPYYNSLRIGLIVAHQAWDGLVYRDPDSFTIKPLLATSWKYIDDTTLEFELRRGVKFHDGSPFSADDVVYTINTILTDKKVAVPSNYAWIAGAEKIDDYKVRVKLKRIFPAALEYLSMVVPIWPKAYRERVGEEAYSKAPVGAGPYRITKVDGVSQIDFERFADYYPDSPKGKPAINKLVIRSVTDSSGELNALLGNKADWIWNFPADNFDNINRVPTLQALRAESMRVGYLSIDAAGRTGAGNPLTNVKVRQAIYHAIDRVAIAKNLVQGGSRVPDAPCYPTQFGCDAAAAMRYDYNPAKAKALLAEAGYPEGFETELVTYILPQWGGAVQNYLKAVGINARISQLQASAALQRSLEGKNPLYLASWGSYSINDVSAILPFFFTGGGDDYVRDPELKALVEKGGATTDPDERRKFYSAAIKRITENAYWLPLHTYVTTYGISRQLNFKPYPDELPRFYLSSWK
ncbi:ABC transporter substrate-binding protein [Limobrevibacterium gyesilva]|uniref:ABC transporter substrate-binding protein n=1 Tax=Limobrevibacterium gyesilva TaxID=2991712 RepID=A0AA42CH78_9PROT|nr:ABC transporter substrate-binding protein [Limobrevibacterium gyesilva]MCW3474560.1 ABC transporter substrate-binding protein [Limobrevibacterium gyesilva]